MTRSFRLIQSRFLRWWPNAERQRDGPTGIEVAERIRQHFAWAGVLPVAFITGELVSPRALRDFTEPFVLLRKSSAPESTLAEVSRFVAAQQATALGQARDR